MQLFVGVIIVASIIMVALLTLNLISPLDEEKITDRIDADKIPIVLTDTLESEMKDIESMNETKTIDSENDDWKKIAFPELYDDNGERWVKYDETKIRIYVEDIPVNSHTPIMAGHVVGNALLSWSVKNPKLDFAIIDDIRLSDIDIKWVNNISMNTNPTGEITVKYHLPGEAYVPSFHTLGITKTTITDYGSYEKIHHEIQIDLSDKDCNKQKIFWDADTVTDTVKHEFGHALGLEHSSDENNLMYGEDGTEEMLSNGLVIPEKTSEFHYIGEKQVLDEVEFYENKFSAELRSHGWTVEDWESGRFTNNDSFIKKINSIIDDWNPVIDKYNCFALSK